MENLIFSAVLTLMLVSFLSQANASDKIQHADESVENEKVVMAVSVERPIYRRVQQTIVANGEVKARELAAVTAQTAGLILKAIHADIGDVVEKGQILAEYDASTVANDIAQAKASLTQAQVGYNQAHSNAKRVKKLLSSKAISAIEADNYHFQEQSALAQLNAPKAMLKNQQLRGQYAKVTAKTDGLIIEKQAVLGEVGNPGTPLFSLIVDSELEWLADLPSEQLIGVSVGMPVNVTLPDDGAEQTLTGQVRKISPTINPKTRLGKVYVTLPENVQLRQGLYLQGELISNETRKLTIPLTAITRKDGYDYVFVVDDQNKLVRKKVSMGQLKSQWVSIDEGLADTDRVVVDGVGFLNAGDRVRVLETTRLSTDSDSLQQ